MKKLVVLFLASGLFLFATGCAPKQVVKTWSASGGSKADAVVEVGFTYNPQLEKPDVSETQARNEALQRCKAWGYEDAEPFGMYKEQCQQWFGNPFSGPQCTLMLVTRQFQCLDHQAVRNNPQSGYSGTGKNFSNDPNFVGPMIPGNSK